MSLFFLVAYSYATQRFSRAKLFNIIVGIFLLFFASFAGLYPHHQVSNSHNMRVLIACLDDGPPLLSPTFRFKGWAYN